MVASQVVDQQLQSLGIRFRYFGRSEVRELKRILIPGELIVHAANGVYEGGFAMVVATNLRLLLIDKKPFKLNIEDLRYQTISEVCFQGRVLDAMMIVNLPHKELTFRSWHQPRLRAITAYVQERVMRSSPDWQQQYRAGLLNPGQRSGVGIQVSPTSETSTLPYQAELYHARRTESALQRALSRLAIKQLYALTAKQA